MGMPAALCKGNDVLYPASMPNILVIFFIFTKEQIYTVILDFNEYRALIYIKLLVYIFPWLKTEAFEVARCLFIPLNFSLNLRKKII